MGRGPISSVRRGSYRGCGVYPHRILKLHGKSSANYTAIIGNRLFLAAHALVWGWRARGISSGLIFRWLGLRDCDNWPFCECGCSRNYKHSGTTADQGSSDIADEYASDAADEYASDAADVYASNPTDEHYSAAAAADIYTGDAANEYTGDTADVYASNSTDDYTAAGYLNADPYRDTTTTFANHYYV